MYVKLIGPEDLRVSEHKVDAATAVLLLNQLRSREQTPDGRDAPLRMTLDDEVVLVTEAVCKFWTKGETFDGEITLQLAEAL